ncbi:MAG: DNA internalization-related competence protein ComEC/Rec2 [Proteobacteria bacterium]|nr:DNA internalization-related competence protein ComEC/Rec2 [Pseudomonadota bacterium]
MRFAPLLLAATALAWVLGVAVQMHQPLLWAGWVYALWAAAALAMLLLRRPMRWPLAALVLAFASTGWRASVQDGQRLPAVLEGRPVTVTGRIAGLPALSAQGPRFVLAVVDAPPGVPARLLLRWPSSADAGDAQAGWAGAPPAVHAGELWRLTVRLRRPHGNANPGGFDAELWLWEQGIGAVGSVAPQRAGDVQRLAQGSPWRIDAWRERVRDALLLRVGEQPQAGVLAALTVGEQSAIDGASWEVFRRTGVAHLVSISGLHITAFAWLAQALLGLLWRRSATLCMRVPAPLAASWGGVALALLYAVFSGWGVPAQRTVWMLALAVAVRGSGLGWPAPLQALLVAAGVLLLDPWALMQPGFWLSFGAVVLLMLGDARTPRGWRAHLVQMLRTQALASVALAPLAAVLFQQVSVVGLLANLLAVPWITWVVTPLALAGMVLAPLWQMAAWALAPLLAVLNALAAWPQAIWTVPQAPPVVVVLAVAGAVLLAARLPWWLRSAGVVAVLPLLLWRPAPLPDGRFELLAADVGQGGAVLVRTRHHALLHDAGPRLGDDADAGQRVLVPLLRALDVRRLDELVISHQDSDHVGGAASVLAALPVAQLRHRLPPGHPLLATPMPVLRCEAGQHWVWDGVRFAVMHPVGEMAGAKPNAQSCVLRIEDAAGRRAWLLADIEAAQEAALLASLPPQALRTDVAIVAHHGSATSSSAAWLAATTPQVAVAQQGWRNRFNHPHPDVTARHAAMGIPLVRSDTCGAWTWRSDQEPRQATCARQVMRRYWHWQPE